MKHSSVRYPDVLIFTVPTGKLLRQKISVWNSGAPALWVSLDFAHPTATPLLEQSKAMKTMEGRQK